MDASQVRDEAFHKMTLMKAEYTGRVKRRDDKIAELEAKLGKGCGATGAASCVASDDKENDVSLSNLNDKSSNSSKSKTSHSKPAKVDKALGLEELSEVDAQPAKRSTRSSTRALAPV